MNDQANRDSDDRVVERVLGACRPDATPPPGSEQRVLGRLLAHIDARERGPAVVMWGRRRPLVLVARMGSVAMAAVVLILACWWVVGGGVQTASADFADVLRQIRKATSVSYEIAYHPLGRVEERGHVQMAGGRTRVAWADGTVHVFDESRRSVVTLSPILKEVRSAPLPGLPYCDLLGTLRTVGKSSGRHTGREPVDGTTTDVYQVALARGATLKMWVEPVTDLPVRVEMLVSAADGTHTLAIMTGFAWNSRIEDSVFHIEVPDGYTFTRFGEEPSSTDLLRVLAVCASRSGGVYPQTLDAASLFAIVLGEDSMRTSDVGDAMSVSYVDPEAKVLLRDCLPGLTFVEKIRETGTWQYVGDGVELGDGSREVCWWTSPGSATRTVVYGDLRIVDRPFSDPSSEKGEAPNR